jgi:hypothetical protein
VFGYSELSANFIGETVSDRVTITLPPGIATGGDGKIINISIADLKQPWSRSLESTLHDHTANEVFA